MIFGQNSDFLITKVVIKTCTKHVFSWSNNIFALGTVDVFVLHTKFSLKLQISGLFFSSTDFLVVEFKCFLLKIVLPGKIVEILGKSHRNNKKYLVRGVV